TGARAANRRRPGHVVCRTDIINGNYEGAIWSGGRRRPLIDDPEWIHTAACLRRALVDDASRKNCTASAPTGWTLMDEAKGKHAPPVAAGRRPLVHQSPRKYTASPAAGWQTLMDEAKGKHAASVAARRRTLVHQSARKYSATAAGGRAL